MKIGNIKIGNYESDEILFSRSLEIKQKLSSKELYYLKYLNPLSKIIINTYCLEDSLPVIAKINNLGYKNKITVIINKKEEFDAFLKNNYDLVINSNISIVLNNEEVDIKKYIELEKILDDMVKPILNNSTFERYLYVYNLTKNYKKYKANPYGNKSEDKALYKILENDYIDCYGFANLFAALLTRVKIPFRFFNLYSDISYYSVNPTKEEFDEVIPVEFVGHRRAIVNIVDSKYNINGLFFSDVSWDNTGHELIDSYLYFLYNQKQYTYNKAYTLFDTYGCIELFFSDNLEEFYKRVNFLKQRNTFDKYYDILMELLSYLYDLDIIFYNVITNKYHEDIESRAIVNNNAFYDDIGSYIVRRVNRKINYETLRKGIDFIYKNYYGFDDSLKREEEIDAVLQSNSDFNEYFFPVEYLNPEEKEDFNNFKSTYK